MEAQMRFVKACTITDTIERLCIEANISLNQDVMNSLRRNRDTEVSHTGRVVLDSIIENAEIAKDEGVPMCQDTGMAVVFAEIGQQVHITEGSITQAINEGVRRGYEKGYLRKSIVRDPVDRINTGDNTPAVIHYDIVDGDSIRLVLVPKGFGSENMSALKMLKPSDGIDGIYEFIIKTVEDAGPNPCPPIVVGVGIGGTMEKAAILSKKALLRPLDARGDIVEYVRELEERLLEDINRIGIGPAGIGGSTTALAVNIEVFPTHIAGLPVAVNISCHALRHAEAVI
jgi:fumarate hydratase subunit alpha